MPKRLVELYTVGDRVAITFDGEPWTPGRVARLDHPGVWVETPDWRQWFVTNARRIKKVSGEIVDFDVRTLE